MLLDNAARRSERAGLRAHDGAKRRRAREIRPPHDLWRNRDAFADVPSDSAATITPADLKPVERLPPDRPRHDARRTAAARSTAARNTRSTCRCRACSTRRCCARRSKAPSPERIDDAAARAISASSAPCASTTASACSRETPYAAIEARQALIGNVTWSRTGTAQGFDSDRASVEFAARRARRLAATAKPWEPRGNASVALSNAATVVEAEYLNDYTYHAQMEPLNAVASVSPSGDSAEIWCGTQSQTMAQEAVAKVLGIPREPRSRCTTC